MIIWFLVVPHLATLDLTCVNVKFKGKFPEAFNISSLLYKVKHKPTPGNTEINKWVKF